jgi:hypothetical protein
MQCMAITMNKWAGCTNRMNKVKIVQSTYRHADANWFLMYKTKTDQSLTYAQDLQIQKDIRLRVLEKYT